MNDLISRKEAVFIINAIDVNKPWDDKEDMVEQAIGILDHLPTAYDVDKVVKHLKKEQHSQYEHWKKFGDNESFVAMNIYGCAIGIVKEELKNNNNTLS